MEKTTLVFFLTRSNLLKCHNYQKLNNNQKTLQCFEACQLVEGVRIKI